VSARRRSEIPLFSRSIEPLSGLTIAPQEPDIGTELSTESAPHFRGSW
jgi:hypothetical protein